MNVLSGMGVGVRGCVGGDIESKKIALFPASEMLSPKTSRFENGSAPAGPGPSNAQRSAICAATRTSCFTSVMEPPFVAPLEEEAIMARTVAAAHPTILAEYHSG